MTETDLQRKAKELKKQYLAEWRARNKDRIKEYNKNYWLQKAREAVEGEQTATR